MKQLAVIVLVALAVWASGYAQAQEANQGSWDGEVFTSAHPEFSVSVREGLEYLGDHRFDLYDVADVERHYFAKVEGRTIQQLLVFQFEAYHDDNEYTYTIPSDNLETVSGLQFGSNDDGVGLINLDRFLERWAGRGTEYELSGEWLKRNDYVLPAELALLVRTHILEGRREELIILYWEPLSSMGLSFDGLGIDPEDLRGRVPEFLLSDQYGNRVEEIAELSAFLDRARQTVAEAEAP